MCIPANGKVGVVHDTLYHTICICGGIMFDCHVVINTTQFLLQDQGEFLVGGGEAAPA